MRFAIPNKKQKKLINRDTNRIRIFVKLEALFTRNAMMLNLESHKGIKFNKLNVSIIFILRRNIDL